MSPTSDITDVRKCPIGQYPLMSAVMGGRRRLSNCVVSQFCQRRNGGMFSTETSSI